MTHKIYVRQSIAQCGVDIKETLPDESGRSNFFYSFRLPRDERMAMQSVYEFCRYTDDLVDEDIPPDIPE